MIYAPSAPPPNLFPHGGGHPEQRWDPLTRHPRLLYCGLATRCCFLFEAPREVSFILSMHWYFSCSYFSLSTKRENKAKASFKNSGRELIHFLEMKSCLLVYKAHKMCLSQFFSNLPALFIYIIFLVPVDIWVFDPENRYSKAVWGKKNKPLTANG